MEFFQNDYGIVTLHDTAFNKKCCVYRITSYTNNVSLSEFFRKFTSILKAIVENVQRQSSIIANVKLRAKMVDDKHSDDGIREASFHFSTKMEKIYIFEAWMQNVIRVIENQIETFVDKGSGWSMDNIEFAEFCYITS